MMGALSASNLDKGKGNCIDKLRIIQLVEADLNFILKLIWGHHLNQAAYRNHLYNESQFAILGKTCTSAVLNKVVCRPNPPNQMPILYD